MKTKQSILISACVLSNLFFLCSDCCRNCSDFANRPSLTTAEVIGITSNWAISGGDISDNGGAEITERGICWGTADPPSISDQKATSGIGEGEYTCTFIGLEGNTTYYLRAFASNEDSTWYGEVRSFSTPPTATDVEGNEFPTVIIGTQTWMARNLSVTHYRNGDPITYIPEGESWGETEAGEYCDYDLIGKLGGSYGYFYNWYALSDPRSIAPDGWHVPSDEDWTVLIDYLGGLSDAGEKLRETGFRHWLEKIDGVSIPGGTNESGFTALGAGMQGDDHRGWDARFWTSTLQDVDKARYCGVELTNIIFRANEDLNYGISVRLVKDQ